MGLPSNSPHVNIQCDGRELLPLTEYLAIMEIVTDASLSLLCSFHFCIEAYVIGCKSGRFSSYGNALLSLALLEEFNQNQMK